MLVKKLLPLIGIIILAYLLITLDVGRIITIFLSINPWYSVLGVFAVLPIVLLSNIQWQILLRKQRIHVRFRDSFKNIFIGYFYGSITPGGFGAYVRAFYLQHVSDASLPKCVSNIITFNTIDYITLLVFGLAGGLLLGSRFPTLFLIIGVLLGIILVLFIFFLRKEQSKKMFIRFLQLRVFEAVKHRLKEPVESFYEDLPSFKDVVLPMLLSFVGWGVRFVELYVLSFAFGFTVPFIYFIVIIAVADVVATVPISIYGLGTREATLLSLFSIYAIAPEQILALSLYWFAVIWVVPSGIGALVSTSESRRTGKPSLSP